MKKLSYYIKFLGTVVKHATVIADLPITGITNNSRSVQPGNLFVAIAGEVADGHDYIHAAIKAGAVGVIFSRPFDLPADINGIMVSDSYLAYARVAECFYNSPSHDLRLTAITGTNGKTTTAYILTNLLHYYGLQCGLITTVKYVVGNRTVPASRTTPEALELQQLFRQMVDAGCSDVVMEASSHGLLQHRLGGACCQVVVFTNLTGDHLDYHRTMENYFKAKTILFTEYLTDNGYAVINLDDPYGERLSAMLSSHHVITFGKQQHSTLKISNIELSRAGSSFDLEYGGDIVKLDIRLAGEHNIYNFTAACAAAVALGIPLSVIRKHATESFTVPGRLELLQLHNSPTVYVDYAHTDDALENILKILQRLKTGKLITLFGCGGDRDKTKRARMGAVAEKFSDYIILTNDNPRSEPPEAILADIKSGITNGCRVEIIPDRAMAISRALDIAVHEDVVLIAGKGHETTQEQNGIFTPFDDREITRHFLNHRYL